MPHADHGGLRVHYEVEGAGPPLVLQHGFTLSLKRWYALGYVNELKAQYRLILVDARGHGESDKPHDPAAYTLALRVGDVVAVLDALTLDTAHYWGYSMGGWIGFGMAMYARERVRSLIIGGAHPYEERLPAATKLEARTLTHSWPRSSGGPGLQVAFRLPSERNCWRMTSAPWPPRNRTAPRSKRCCPL